MKLWTDDEFRAKVIYHLALISVALGIWTILLSLFGSYFNLTP